MSDDHTPGPLPPRQRSSHGCLWGCLAAAVLVTAVVAGGFGYMGWFVYSSFKNDPALQAIVHSMEHDGVTRRVLGDHIVVTSVESTNLSTDAVHGTTHTYVAHLKGPKGEGRIVVTVHVVDGKNTATSLILTGPDGQSYDLREAAGTEGQGDK